MAAFVKSVELMRCLGQYQAHAVWRPDVQRARILAQHLLVLLRLGDVLFALLLHRSVIRCHQCRTNATIQLSPLSHQDLSQVYHEPGPWVNLSSASRFGEYEALDIDIRDVVLHRFQGPQRRRSKSADWWGENDQVLRHAAPV